MKKLLKASPLLPIVAIVLIFFYKTFLSGLIPFPGDLLVSEYKPWQTSSYLGYNPGGIPNKAQYPDTIRQLYPWKTEVIREIKLGKLPLWNPYNFSGTPLLANFQSAPFYPLSIFYLFLPQTLAWTILVILQPLLAFVFMYFYGREISLSRFGALFAGLIWAFSSFMTVWLQYNTIVHVALWLPLILLSIEQLRKKIRPAWLLLFIVANVSSLLAGHPQLFGYLFVFSLLYAGIRLSRKTFYFVLLAALLAVGIAGIQLIPGIELILQAARSAHSYTTLMQKILLQPWHLLMLLIPDFFGNPATRNYWLGDTYIGKVTSIGIVPLLFVVIGARMRQAPLQKFFGWSAVIVGILITANPVSAMLYRLPLPLLSASSPTLMTFLFIFSLCALSGFGITTWEENEHLRRSAFWIGLPIAILLASLWIVLFLFPNVFPGAALVIAKRNLLYATVIAMTAFTFLALARRTGKHVSIFFVFLFLLAAADLLYSFQKFNPFVPTSLIFPPHPVFSFLSEQNDYQRFWGYGTASIEANLATQFHLYSTDGYDPLYPARYGRFIYAAKNGKILSEFTNDTRSDAVLAPGFGQRDLADNPYRKKIMNVLGVTYVLDRAENGGTTITFPPNQFERIAMLEGWNIYKNLHAAPRVFIANDYRVFESDIEFERLFFDPALNPAQTILLEEDPAIPKTPAASGMATILLYEPDAISIRAETNIQSLLFLSDTYYPGWEAYVDNVRTKIYRADFAFRAVTIPKGEHTVTFIYRPASLLYGTLLTVISFLGTIGILFYAKRYGKDN